jgi:hypothetical protein
MNDIPVLPVSVCMRRERVPGPMARWQPWRWVLAGVQPLEPSGTPGGPACTASSADHALWEFPGMEVALHRDDAEGLYLNASTPQPCWWVMWRLQDWPGQEEPVAVPVEVTLSYHDAGRWLDAQEQVDRLDAPPDVVAWLRDFTDTHHRPEPKRRKRPDSFRPLTDRFGNPVSISTGKGGPRGPGHGH